MTDNAAWFTRNSSARRAEQSLAVCEGKTIHQFTDRWNTIPRYSIALDLLARKAQWLENMQYFRAACREIASATNERTAIAAILPPRVLCGHTICVERRPAQRSSVHALILVGLMNSFSFDWLLRQKAATHVSLYLLADLPLPELSEEADRFLAHGCLRLSCNHAAFAPLWREQLGDAWRENTVRHSWPVVATDHDRWYLRAAMDAVVAQAYGLDHTQYARVLSSFSHRSCKAAPQLCLEAFARLAHEGLAGFCRQHDPYDDIPPVTAIAAPVITLQ